jgi:hypothetical protein
VTTGSKVMTAAAQGHVNAWLGASGSTKPGPTGPSAREGRRKISGKMGWHERTV